AQGAEEDQVHACAPLLSQAGKFIGGIVLLRRASCQQKLADVCLVRPPTTPPMRSKRVTGRGRGCYSRQPARQYAVQTAVREFLATSLRGCAPHAALTSSVSLPYQELDMFSHLPLYAGDPILSLQQAYLAEPRADKVNLGIGAYQNATGAIPTLRSVAAVRPALAADLG